MPSARLHYVKALFALSLAALVFVATGTVQAEDPKPKPKPDTPTETVTLVFTKVEFTYKTDGSPGPLVTLGGVLHLASQALLSDSGVPIGFRLHSNLSNATALTDGGGAAFVVVGASDGIPTECDACAPSSWTFTFRLIPQGSGLQPSLLLDLTISTQYDAGGALVDACVAGEEDCDVEVLIP